MTTLLLLLALQDPGAWKAKSLSIVVQHSGAQRSMGPAILSLLQRILALRPEETEVGMVGFDRDFQQLEGQRFSRKPAELQARTTDRDALHEAVSGLVFHGPSPVYDAVMLTLETQKPERILLVSNGIDNASQTSFDELLAAAGKAGVPVSILYLAAEPPSGGDTRLKKLAKATNGKFVDIRLKDSWDQLMSALR